MFKIHMERGSVAKFSWCLTSQHKQCYVQNEYNKCSCECHMEGDTMAKMASLHAEGYTDADLEYPELAESLLVD